MQENPNPEAFITTTTHDTARLLAAMRFATRKHRHQRRKGADQRPYIEHPVDVAELLARVGGVTDVEVLMAALLHDTVEDTDTTPAELEARFGPAVAALVGEMTDDKSLPKEARKEAQVEHAPHLSARAKLVKLADKSCNVRDITINPPADWPDRRRAEYFDWTERVVAGVRGTHAALEAHYDRTLAMARALLADATG